MIVSFDIDGVLADYAKSFSEIGNELFRLPIVEKDEIEHWNWEKWWGTKEQVQAVWDEVISNRPMFWSELERLISDDDAHRITKLMFEGATYFITNRPDTGGTTAHFQTMSWLKWNVCGYLRPESRPGASVLVSSKKGKLCEALGVQHHIDDKFTYCIDIVKSSPSTQVYMLERQHNAWIPDHFPSYFEERKGRREVIVVKSVTEYLNRIGA